MLTFDPAALSSEMEGFLFYLRLFQFFNYKSHKNFKYIVFFEMKNKRLSEI